MKRTKAKSGWVGTAQVFVDAAGYSRAVLIHERGSTYRLIGPIGCVGAGVGETQDREGGKTKLKRLLERQLRLAGY